MRLARILIPFVVLLALPLILTAQASQQEPKVVRVGGDYDFPPFEYLDVNQQPAGYNVELTRAIAEAMGFQVEFHLGKWSKVKDWLDRDEIDIIEGISYSPGRNAKYEFSLPHSETWRSFFVRRDSRFKSQKDLTSATLALQEGDAALDYLPVSRFTGKRFYTPTQDDALLLVSQGKFDAAVITYMSGAFLIKRDKLSNLKAIGEPFAPRFYCYAVRKGDNQLLNDFNTGLSILKENGRYKEIQHRWMGGTSLESIAHRLLLRRMFYIFVPFFLIFLTALIWALTMRRQVNRKSRELQQELDGRLKYETELNREYRMFVNGPVIVYKLTGDPLVISYISENIQQFGYDAKALIMLQKPFSELIYSADKEAVLEQFKADLKEGCEFSSKQYRVISGTNQVSWVFDYTLIVREDGSPPWFYGYMLDISAQKSLEADLLEAKEKAETANIAKGHFLSNISHEIRTPLNGIIGFIQVLQNTRFTEEQQEYMNLISSSGKTLMKIVNDILDFSKMESGKLDLVVTDFNPRYLIDDIIKTFSSGSAQPNVDLRMRISDKLPSILYGDMMRLRQILINLMQNAIKFTDSGYIEISAEVYNQQNDDIRLLISVRDTGIGIDPLKQRDIFDSFLQTDPSLTRKYGGAGLGLSIVKRLVSLMGGFIWVESELNKGSSFFLILGFKTKPNESAQFITNLEVEPGKQEPLPQLSVLLVEDEPVNQLVTRKQLEIWNLKVSLAETGTQAMDMIHNQQFDCILMDIQMPEMDGITVTRKIREQELKTHRHIPIIAFTASAMAGDRERFIASGMDEYIAKPIDIDYLYLLLHKVKPADFR